MVTRRHFVSQLAAGASLGWWMTAGKASAIQERQAVPLTTNHAAATVHPLATQAAEEILQKGGNAIDAAIAAALVLGVVDGHNSGIGGGCLALIRLADGRIRAIDGRETAGSAALPHRFLRDGKPDPTLSQTGPLAAGVPGQIAAMDRMHRAHGSLPWASLFEHAISLAHQGHPASPSTARTLEREAEDLKRFPASRNVLLKANGEPLGEGDLLVQKDLADTLRAIAERGSDWFYAGEFARTTCAYLSSIGGLLKESDFARYQALDRPPLPIAYRGYCVIGFPPPSSGGIHIAQILGMLSRDSVSNSFKNSSVDGYHLVAECMKRAFADRAYWLGDSDFVHVPNGLLDAEYLRSRMQDFSASAASAGIVRGSPPGSDPEPYPSAEIPGQAEDRKHTTHLTVADRSGNWVAMTCTVNTSWGSKVMVPGTGVILNNEMDDFSLAPGTPNAFGLVGSFANAVAPGKRPLSSMSPSLVLDADRLPCVTCGAAGGPRIISATLQILVRTLDLEQSISDAIAGTRIHHQWRPDTLAVETAVRGTDPYAITPETIRGLETLGHTVRPTESLAVAQGIQRRGDRLYAAHDPRSRGSSAS
ncbi:MAG: gamma-glutamyltransferase [Planctomycetota bacterium]|jgi:gamma-glutamyltranspeptidase/glutathione hydrolase